MKKTHALILAILITGLIAGNFYLFSISSQKSTKSVLVSRVIDGDTFVLQDGSSIRLVNINSPEKNAPGFEKSKAFLQQFENKTLELEEWKLGKYSRILGRAYTPEYLNLEIVKLGLANKFLVSNSEKEEFAKAEKEAIEKEKGIWKKSSFFGCFTTEIKEKEEIIIIKNSCPQINISSWILKDEGRKTYKFENLQLGEIRVHSFSGLNNESDLFWNSKTDIWNNDRDSLYLFDSKGELAHYEVYGY